MKLNCVLWLNRRLNLEFMVRRWRRLWPINFIATTINSLIVYKKSYNVRLTWSLIHEIRVQLEVLSVRWSITVFVKRINVAGHYLTINVELLQVSCKNLRLTFSTNNFLGGSTDFIAVNPIFFIILTFNFQLVITRLILNFVFLCQEIVVYYLLQISVSCFEFLLKIVIGLILALNVLSA